jgi:hypothetical protein
MKTQSPFTFAILTDSHIRLPQERNGPDDYPSNQLFNDRNRYVVRQINRLSPDFIVHLGDIPHLIPALPDFKKNMLMAKEIFQDFDSRLYVLPGNHDIGDKPNAWTPAPAVSNESQAVFESIWGRSFQAFDHADCRFYLINSPILNSGLQCEVDQRQWLESDLASNQEAGKRVFLFTHYPLYINRPDEAEHYDNIGQPARSWLLSLLERYSVSSVFTGHTHNFFYNRYRDTDLYVLPSVAFVRPEFSEMYQIEPALEYGRNDIEKLGFFYVHVGQGGYYVEPIRTHGLSEEQGDSIEFHPTPLSGSRAQVLISPVGVFLRHSWASSIKLPFDNLDEFTRKQVRNDYPLLALWELGIRKLRVPISDIADEETIQRILALRPLGFDFTFFSIGLPDDQIKEALIQHHDLVDCWEIIAPWDQIPDVLRSIRKVKRKTGIRVVLSKLNTLADQQVCDDFYFSHFPSHGFRLNEWDLILMCIEDFGASEAVDGFVYRIPPDIDPWAGIESASQFSKKHNTTASVHIQMPRGSEGVAYVQDGELSNRIAETLMAAISFNSVSVYVDTFIDHDRGYYPRNGLLDRRCNPRPAYYVLRNIQRALGTHLVSGEVLSLTSLHPVVTKPNIETKVEISPGLRSFTLGTSQFRYSLLISDKEGINNKLTLSLETGNDLGKRIVKKMDVLTGKVTSA